MNQTPHNGDDGNPLTGLWLALAAFGLGGLLCVGVVWRHGGPMPTAEPVLASGAVAGHDRHDAALRALAARLQARLRSDPDDAESWAMLAHTFALSGQPAAAIAAYRRALGLRPDDAGLLADLAEALSTAQGRRLHGEPITLVRRALERAPGHPKARLLAGREAYERGDWPAAAGHWEQLQSATGPHGVFARQARADLADARRRAAADDPARRPLAPGPAAP